MTKEEVVAKIEWAQEKLKDDIVRFHKELKKKRTHDPAKETLQDVMARSVDALMLEKKIDECQIAYSMLDWVKEMLEMKEDEVCLGCAYRVGCPKFNPRWAEEDECATEEDEDE